MNIELPLRKNTFVEVHAWQPKHWLHFSQMIVEMSCFWKIQRRDHCFYLKEDEESKSWEQDAAWDCLTMDVANDTWYF